MATIVVDRETCMGSGVCVSYAAATFAQDAEGKAIVLDPTGDTSEIVAFAVEGCPVGALMLIDEGGQ